MIQYLPGIKEYFTRARDPPQDRVKKFPETEVNISSDSSPKNNQDLKLPEVE
ncbi:25712_t:CDS:2, partial [Racocetra persica]